MALVIKNPLAKTGDIRDMSSGPGSGRSLVGVHGNPLQYSWVSFVAQLVRNPPAMGRPGFYPWVG